jgi:hypothetical protein
MTYTSRTLVVLLTILIAVLAPGCSASAERGVAVQEGSDSRSRLVGTWRYETADDRTYQKITLNLNGNGTYTKTLDARVDGAKYGGTHSGTWTASGTVVALSGDGHFPAITHDLATFTKD